MKINQYGQVQISTADAFTALYNHKINNLQDVFIEDIAAINQYNQARDVNADKISQLVALVVPNIPVEEFDKINQLDWFMPPKYKEFDVFSWLYDQCTTDVQRDRVSTEVELFIQYGMYDLLVYLKYLVDTMRENKIVWGVGRGSSVASYCLYLLGIHKVDSLLYELDIREFLK